MGRHRRSCKCRRTTNREIGGSPSALVLYELFSMSLLIDVLRTFSHGRDGITGFELDLFGTGRQGIASWLLRNQEKDHDQ